MATESQWVSFRIGDEIFGMEIQYVREMLRLPGVHRIPHAATDNLGVILLRKEVIPIFDLPRRFGMTSSQERGDDLIALLQARQKDHEDWLTELERSVAEQHEFTLTTDPHVCKFGKWYDHFTTDNVWLRRVLKQFDDPHKRIHAIGEQVKGFMAKGDSEQARALLQFARNTVLNQLVRLFGEAQEEIRDHNRKGLIVVGTASETIGVAVDEIHSVLRCSDEEIQPPDSIPGIEQFPGLIGLLPQKNSKKFIMLLDPAAIYPQLISAASSSGSVSAPMTG